jgi:hypothetical protein
MFNFEWNVRIIKYSKLGWICGNTAAAYFKISSQNMLLQRQNFKLRKEPSGISSELPPLLDICFCDCHSLSRRVQGPGVQQSLVANRYRLTNRIISFNVAQVTYAVETAVLDYRCLATPHEAHSPSAPIFRENDELMKSDTSWHVKPNIEEWNLLFAVGILKIIVALNGEVPSGQRLRTGQQRTEHADSSYEPGAYPGNVTCSVLRGNIGCLKLGIRARSEGFTAKLLITVCRFMRPRSPIGDCQSFGGIYRFHLRSRWRPTMMYDVIIQQTAIQRHLLYTSVSPNSYWDINWKQMTNIYLERLNVIYLWSPFHFISRYKQLCRLFDTDGQTNKLGLIQQINKTRWTAFTSRTQKWRVTQEVII